MIVKTLEEQYEALSKSSYDRLAKKYYSALHPTTRVFDYIISCYIRENPIFIESNETYLEVGCGKARLVDICDDKSVQIILIDISQNMLLNSQVYFNPKNVPGIVASAVHMPLSTNTIKGLYSFLGDPFNTPVYFKEAFRVLKVGGEFLSIIPNYFWAVTLRKNLGIAINTTVFWNDNEKIIAPSFVLSNRELKKKLKEEGFSEVILKDLFLPNQFPDEQIPDQILIPIKELNVAPYELPILTAIYAVK